MTPKKSARLDELAEIGQDPAKRAQYPYFEPYTHGNIQGTKATFPSGESAKAYLKGKLVRKFGELTWFIPKPAKAFPQSAYPTKPSEPSGHPQP